MTPHHPSLLPPHPTPPQLIPMSSCFVPCSLPNLLLSIFSFIPLIVPVLPYPPLDIISSPHCYCCYGCGCHDCSWLLLFVYDGMMKQAVGFFNSGINTGPGVIMFAPNPLGSSVGEASSMTSSWMFSLVLTAVLSSLLSFAVAYYIMTKGKYSGSGGSGGGGYRSIPGMSGVGLGSLREASTNNDTTPTNNTTNNNTTNYHHNYPLKKASSSKKNKNHDQFSSTELAAMVPGSVASKSEYLTLDI